MKTPPCVLTAAALEGAAGPAHADTADQVMVRACGSTMVLKAQ